MWYIWGMLGFCRACNLYLPLAGRLCLFCTPESVPPKKPRKCSIRNTKAYKDWRREVIASSPDECALCSAPWEHVDHIVPLRVVRTMGEQALWDVKNGRLLCRACHGAQATTPRALGKRMLGI